MQGTTIGRVLSIALRCREKDKMTEVPEAAAVQNGGLEGDLASRPERGITFIAARQWEEVQRELGVEIPWYTRRANVLVDADSLGHLIGRRIRVGEAEVQVHAETEPCGLMDRLEPGLRLALTPDCRAGVHGRVVRAGRIRVQDEIVLADEQE